MKRLLFSTALVAALISAPAYADYDVKDATGATLTFESSVVGGNHIGKSTPTHSDGTILSGAAGTAPAVGLSVQGMAGGTALPVSVATIPSHAVTNAGTFAVQNTAALPAGTNNIGDVDVLTIAAGNNNIGDVDIASIAAGNNIIGQVKLSDGTDISDILDLASSNPLAVAIVDATGAQIASFGGGTQYNEADVDATITGTAMLWEDTSDTLRAVSAAKPLPTVQTGALVAGNNNIGDVDIASTTPGTGAANEGKAEDAAHATGDTGVMALGVRRDTAAALAGTDGDYIPPSTNARGALWVAIENGAGAQASIATDKAEDSASADADTGPVVMAIQKATPADTAGTDGDYQPLQMKNGKLWTAPVGFAANPSTDVTRPADTTAYTINDAWSDSTSAPTSGGFTLTNACRVSGGSALLVDAIITTSADAATLLQGEIWVFNQAVTNINDNAAFAVSDAEIKTYVAKIPFQMEDAGNNGSASVTGLGVQATCVGSANLRYLVKVKNAYTPVSGEVLTVVLKTAPLD